MESVMDIEGVKLHLKETLKHKAWVLFYMSKFAGEVFLRGLMHDNSKLSVEESEGFSMLTHKLKKTEYNSPEYHELLKKLEPTLEKHYGANSHHPEHFGDRGLSGMNLLDVVEMFFDWMASTKRMKDGDIERSVMSNKERFHTETALTWVLLNEGRRHVGEGVQAVDEVSGSGCSGV